MQMMKNEKGVTLTALVTTIIVLMILLTISVSLGLDSVNETTDRNLQAEVEMVQQVAITEYTKAKQLNLIKEDENVPANFVGTKLTYSQISTYPVTWVLTDAEIANKGYKSYYKLTPEDLEKLNILNSEYEYIINYYTGEVFNITKKSSSGESLYIKSVNAHPSAETDSTSFVDTF